MAETENLSNILFIFRGHPKVFPADCRAIYSSKIKFLKYLQLQHFLKPKIDKEELRTETTEIEDLLLNPICLKGLISRAYDILSSNCTSALPGLKGVWEKDIGQTIEENDWAIVYDNMYPKCT